MTPSLPVRVHQLVRATDIKYSVCKRLAPPQKYYMEGVRGFPECKDELKVGHRQPGEWRMVPRWHALLKAWGPCAVQYGCRGMWTRDWRLKTEGRNIDTLQYVATWSLRFIVGRGECEQIKRNKVLNRRSQWLVQVQTLRQRTKHANNNLGIRRNPKVNHSITNTALMTQGYLGWCTSASYLYHMLSEMLIGAVTFIPWLKHRVS